MLAFAKTSGLFLIQMQGPRQQLYRAAGLLVQGSVASIIPVCIAAVAQHPARGRAKDALQASHQSRQGIILHETEARQDWAGLMMHETVSISLQKAEGELGGIMRTCSST